jgi:hypothetical protein
VTLARLALAGSRTDTLRVVFTAVSSALAAVTLLAAATVVAVPELGSSRDGSVAWNHYSADLVAQPGLRPGRASGSVRPRGTGGSPRSGWPGPHPGRPC